MISATEISLGIRCVEFGMPSFFVEGCKAGVFIETSPRPTSEGDCREPSRPEPLHLLAERNREVVIQDGYPRVQDEHDLLRTLEGLHSLNAVVENAREYPQKYHWKMTTPLAAATAQIMDNAFLRRDKPEYKNAGWGSACV